MFYSPDSYGLGHVRRTIRLAGELLSRLDSSSGLVLTGAPRSHYFSYPDRCDYVKLPSVTKADNGDYVSREIDLSLKRTIGLRGRLIREAANGFAPDAVLVDHAPLGLCGEMLGTLERVARRRPPALRVLGLRDVIDEPRAVRAAWERQQVFNTLRTAYDLILIYGERGVFDAPRHYGFPADVARKVHFVGYVGAPTPNRDVAAELRQRYAPRTGRLVTVTVGGGGDGNLVLRRFVEGFERLGPHPPFEAILITGPLMSPGKRRRFQDRAQERPGLSLVEHADQLPELFEASDFVVSMAGYNSVCELAAAGARALLVPRVFPRREQLLRSTLLAERGVVNYATLDKLTPTSLIDEVCRGLSRKRPQRGWGLDLGGATNAARRIRALLKPAGGDSRLPLAAPSEVPA